MTHLVPAIPAFSCKQWTSFNCQIFRSCQRKIWQLCRGLLISRVDLIHFTQNKIKQLKKTISFDILKRARNDSATGFDSNYLCKMVASGHTSSVNDHPVELLEQESYIQQQ